MIFDVEIWLWKSEIGTFRSLDLERTLVYQKTFYHSFQLPFDVELAENFLDGT